MPLSIRVQPWDRCTVHPEGAEGDTARTDALSADGEGAIRFYPPPADWTTRLTFDCGPNDGATRRLRVDLNDEATFTRESPSSGSHVMGMRPALTADRLDLSQDELLRKGYPPRPDHVSSPVQYATWLKSVTHPTTIVSTAAAAALGARAGMFQGRFPADTRQQWTGIVQTASGFSSTTSTRGSPLAQAGTQYIIYNVQMTVPPISCNSGLNVNSAWCETSFWGGIGGYPTLDGSGSVTTGPLIQSGFWTNWFGSGTVGLFYEYVGLTADGSMSGPPSFAPLPPNKSFSVGDQFSVWGWSSDSTNCSFGTSGRYACFLFEDVTQAWVTDQRYLQQPSGVSPFSGSTAEWVVELPDINIGYANTQQTNDFYFAEVMTPTALDSAYTSHTIASDPYIFVTQADALLRGDQLNYATFSSLFQYVPDDQPQQSVIFDWSNWQ